MPPTSQSIRILYVEPDPDAAEEMESRLDAQDRYTVMSVAEAAEARTRLRDTDVDCVLSEYELPDGDGLSLLGHVQEAHEDLPFILFTDRGSEAVASEAISQGVTDYVQKTNGERQQTLLTNRIRNAVATHRTQHRTAEMERRFETLTEATNDILWMFTPDWSEVLFVNSAYEEVWGRSQDILEEDPTDFLEGIHPEARPRAINAMEQLGEGKSIDLEYRVNPKENYQRWVWVQGEPVYDEDGTLTRVVGFVRDITARKQYEQELEQATEDLERSNRSLREFAYIASHDLQEPLRMVASYIELLEDEFGEELGAEAREYMDFAVDGARRMRRMINSLLQYSRVHTQAGSLESVDARTVFEDVRRDLEFHIHEHDAEVTVDALPTLSADPDQLAQVFQNLVKNAIEHGGADDTSPHVSVSATEREDTHEFSVSDNGPGIPEAEQSEIFKIFRQGADAAGDEGTGIGLAISQRIVQRHGGEIWVESDAGDGATFKFTIPKDLAETQASTSHDR